MRMTFFDTALSLGGKGMDLGKGGRCIPIPINSMEDDRIL